MKRFALTFAAVFGLLFFLSVGTVLAVSTGEDFEWLSVSAGGLRIGSAGSSSSDPVAGHLEFTGAQQAIDFDDDASITGSGNIDVSSESFNIVAKYSEILAETYEGELDPSPATAGLQVQAIEIDEADDEWNASLLGANGANVGMGTLDFSNEGEFSFEFKAASQVSAAGDVTMSSFVSGASMYIGSNGNVVITLGVGE